MQKKTNNYTTMPLAFEYYDGQILITTDHGDFIWVSQEDFDTFLKGELQPSSSVFHDLKSKQIISNDVALSVDLAAAKLRSRKSWQL